MLALPWMLTAFPGRRLRARTSSSRSPATTRVLRQLDAFSVVENTSFGSSSRARMMRGSSLPSAGRRSSPGS